MRAIVVTTIIKEPNDCLRALARGAAGNMFIIGDVPSPREFDLPGAHWYPLGRQSKEFPQLAGAIPTRHYARKNLGYLAAIKSGATAIHDIDDDNLPLDNFWTERADFEVESVNASPWFNVYSLFTNDFVWPRGFPLQFIQTDSSPSSKKRVIFPRIVQFLADGDPDVDAIFRLTRSSEVKFSHRQPVELSPGTWCPFNSQNTQFRKDVFPLLYLPSNCSFRMTDIWRSFVAQRCLWELGEGVVFHSATVRQDRNEHDLLKDFAQEVDGYLHNDAIRRTLEGLKIDNDMRRSLIVCYEALIAENFLKADELQIVRAWCEAF